MACHLAAALVLPSAQSHCSHNPFKTYNILGTTRLQGFLLWPIGVHNDGTAAAIPGRRRGALYVLSRKIGSAQVLANSANICKRACMRVAYVVCQGQPLWKVRQEAEFD